MLLCIVCVSVFMNCACILCVFRVLFEFCVCLVFLLESYFVHERSIKLEKSQQIANFRLFTIPVNDIKAI